MNFLSNIDELIKSAVNETFYNDEMLRQDKQTASVKSAKLVADKKQEKPKQKDKDDKSKLEKEPDEVEEADDENSSEESAKIKDEPKKDNDTTKDKKTEKPGTQTSKKLKDVDPAEIKQPNFKDIAKYIDLMRGGKSIKDPDVKKNLTDYIERLKPEEKQHVIVYLNSLAQVMAGVKTGLEAAVRPKISSDEEKTTKNNNKQDISSKDKEEPKKKSDSNVIVVGK